MSYYNANMWGLVNFFFFCISVLICQMKMMFWDFFFLQNFLNVEIMGILFEMY